MGITVIIPAYNSASTVGRAVQSVKAQTRRAEEVVVVNDGSTDGTDREVRSLPGIRYIVQPNLGLSAARNRGASEARSEWLLFLDADDRLAPEGLEALSRCIGGSPGHDVYYGKVLRTYPGSPRRDLSGGPESEGPPPRAALTNFMRVKIVSPGAVAIRRSLFEQLGGFRSEHEYAEDRDFYVRAGVRTSFCFCDAVILLKHTGRGTMSSNFRRSIPAALRMQLDFVGEAVSLPHGREFVERFPPGFLLDQAIFRALATDTHEACGELLAIARERGIRTLKSALLRHAPRAVVLHYRLMCLLGGLRGGRPASPRGEAS